MKSVFCVSSPLQNQIKKVLFLIFSDHPLRILNKNCWEPINKKTVAYFPIDLQFETPLDILVLIE